MSYIQLRFTHSLFPVELEDNTMSKYLRDIAKYLDSEKYIITKEILNKFGEETHPHFHANLLTEKEVKKDTIQKWIRNYFNKKGIVIKGVKMYSVRVLVDPNNEERWWRYCLKEKRTEKNNFKFKIKGFTSEEIKFHKLVAQEEREQQIAQNIKNRKKYLETQSFKGKMYKYVIEKYNEKDEKLISHYEFVSSMIEYYRKNDKITPLSKIEEYYVDFQLSTGSKSIQEWYSQTYHQF